MRNIVDYLKGRKDGYDEGVDDGYNKGVKDTIIEVVDIVNMSNYPEDLEMNLCDWLNEKGVKI